MTCARWLGTANTASKETSPESSLHLSVATVIMCTRFNLTSTLVSVVVAPKNVAPQPF